MYDYVLLNDKELYDLAIATWEEYIIAPGETLNQCVQRQNLLNRFQDYNAEMIKRGYKKEPYFKDDNWHQRYEKGK